MPVPKSSLSDPWAALDALLNYSKEPEGPEWFTTREYMTRYACSEATARNSLKKLIDAGSVEVWEGRIASTGKSGHKYRVKP